MTTEFTAELERLRQMIFAVSRSLNREDVEATLLLHQIAERILVLSEADQVTTEVSDAGEGTAEPSQ